MVTYTLIRWSCSYFSCRWEGTRNWLFGIVICKPDLALARLLPEWAELIRDGQTEKVPATDLRIDDQVRVRAGQTFPADGLVISGSTEVDEALLTGESRPVEKRIGDSRHRR